MIAEFQSRSSEEGAAMVRLIESGAVGRHLAALAVTRRLFSSTKALDISFSATYRRATRLLLRSLIDNIDVLRFKWETEPTSAFSLAPLMSRVPRHIPATIVLESGCNNMFTTRGVIHSFYAGRKWHSTDNFSSPCLRPPTTSLPPFDLPPAEEQRLILNLAHGCFGSFRFSPKNNITYITILLPDNIPFKPIPEFPQPPNDFEAEMWTYQEHEAYESKERRHRYSLEERESCYRRLMRATVQVVLSIVATAQFVLPKPVEILVVGLPYCPEGERPQAALRSMIKTYGSVPNASFAPDWRVTPAIFRRLLTAVAERILSLDHLKFQTCDQYRKGVGDKAYKEATRAVNIWPGDRKFQRPVPMSVLARLERLRGADTSEDATLTRNPYSSAGEDEPL